MVVLKTRFVNFLRFIYLFYVLSSATYGHNVVFNEYLGPLGNWPKARSVTDPRERGDSNLGVNSWRTFLLLLRLSPFGWDRLL